jgi:hypothetical protein
MHSKYLLSNLKTRLLEQEMENCNRALPTIVHAASFEAADSVIGVTLPKYAYILIDVGEKQYFS